MKTLNTILSPDVLSGNGGDEAETNIISEAGRTTAASFQAIHTRLSSREMAEHILGEIDWLGDTEGFCVCPGRELHTTHNGKRDCKLYLDHVPTLSCFHGSCEQAVEEANAKLRRALAGGIAGRPSSRLTPEQKSRLRTIQREKNARIKAANSKSIILAQYRWPYENINRDSPADLATNVDQHWRFLLQCFQPSDVVWIGDKYDSGKPDHQRHFRTVESWLKESAAPAPYICPAAFKSNSYTRTNDNILKRRFLVVESDVLGRDEVGAVFKWMEQEVGLKLRAIVDTAGKSLHAWFEYPPDTIVQELKLVLPELGCDPKLFTASQPVRLPSALRDGKPQKLVYLDQEVVA